MNLENIIPTADRLIIKPVGQAEVTKSGILLPENENVATPVVGTIVAAGSESKYKVGQMVFWRRFSIDELKFETEEGEQVVYMVEDAEIIATLKQ